MVGLPSGTVSLLFSDIEGSTVLLSRLGPAYAELLDGQRQVLRAAWSAHGGIELGTEGDSFFVVFPTAENAVRAATRAQRELATYRWPGGEIVRVRMGIHTGTPAIHDGGYVGMDVHRAARISAAAHGGQVVISDVTAKLVAGCLPEGVAVRDMGSHQLKDIAEPERLFQLAIDGLLNDFAPLKTLGATSSLPRPATQLVGRDGELAELTALVGSAGVRLVTLTGPGGSGKTRVAVALAERLVARFPDGVYFTPLAAATTDEVMWSSLAETLDLPPEGRTPTGLLKHMEHRAALLVLDNLEQIDGADHVVARVLDGAPPVVVIATTRRPLHVPAEHEHPVPPLGLPAEPGLAEAQTSGAVQLFVQQARKVRPGFELTAVNVADVSELCRRLDGLPLAIELAAARSKLLSPTALLGRLDKALDMAVSSRQVPDRQRTLRATIGWSYDLLTTQQQAFFRRLGVFAGGADLEALSAVAVDVLDGADPLDVVAALVDASLALVTEGADGEPRMTLLETIHGYALGQLRAGQELEEAARRHGSYYVLRAKELQTLAASQYLEARSLAEQDLDNFRAAMTWAQAGDPSEDNSRRLKVALELPVALGWLWASSGHVREGRQWCESAIQHAEGSRSAELAHCLSELAYLTAMQGHAQRAVQAAGEAVDIARGLDDTTTLIEALAKLGNAQMSNNDLVSSRQSFEEALDRLGPAGAPGRRLAALANLAIIEHMEHRYDRSEALWRQALSIGRDLGNVQQIADIEVNMVSLLDRTGRVTEAHQQARRLVGDVLPLQDPGLTADLADVYADILVRLGDPQMAARLFGAAMATRERDEIPHAEYQEVEVAQTRAAAQQLISADEWHHHYELGRAESLEDLLTQLSRP
jgi:predicted ATPase/class 3 adenylate cyclase